MEKNLLMKHVFCDGFGGPDVLKIKESPLPVYFIAKFNITLCRF